ncbi:MAG: hypothetical protein WA949_05600 [Phormidesmis sp.]
MSGLRDRTPIRTLSRSTPRANSPRNHSPLASVSLGIGTAAAIATTTVHVVERPAVKPTRSTDLLTAQILLPRGFPAQTSAVSAQQIAPEPTSTAPILPLLGQESAFEKARAFGWQAALKGQSPPNTPQHWGEVALLWQQAIYFLDQVPASDPNYAAAREKQAVYEQNLQQIMVRQLAALTTALTTEAKQVAAVSTTQVPGRDVSRREVTQVAPPVVEEDWVAIAKKQGWQAAIASQNAPHPVEKWADISRLWQNALQTLEKIDTQSSQNAEAQVIKAQYQENLSAIRKRYQIEQITAQRLQSLQATLREIERSSPVATNNKRTQLVAIIGRLRTIPQGTTAYSPAQRLIATTTAELNNLPVGPLPRIATASETEAQ